MRRGWRSYSDSGSHGNAAADSNPSAGPTYLNARANVHTAANDNARAHGDGASNDYADA